MLRDVLHLDRIAQIGLVGAVFAHGFVVSDPRKLLCYRLSGGEGLEHAAQDGFHRGKHMLLLDEAHLEVELVELAWQAVGARVFVAETGRNLEVAVEARDHYELLVDLRRLRQRVELALVEARRHQEVARAFRRGRRQDRGRIFGEARLAHAPSHLGDDLRARDDVAVERLAAQIEKAILEADVLGIVWLAEDRQRQFLRRRKHFHVAGEYLDLAGRQIGVDGFRRARLHHAVDADDPLAAHGLGSLEAGRIGIGDDLGEAVMVAQVDEKQAAMIAHAMDPAGQADILADIRFPEGGAGVAAVAVHGIFPDFSVNGAAALWARRRENRPEKRMQAPFCQGEASRSTGRGTCAGS
jgi:hypothetical protein